jgi:hypothetical protein
MEKFSLEERVARIEGILGWMDKRLNHIGEPYWEETGDLRIYSCE